MVELADTHGSGPCESNLMQVRLLLSAPIKQNNTFASEQSQISDCSFFIVCFAFVWHQAFNFCYSPKIKVPTFILNVLFCIYLIFIYRFGNPPYFC